MTPAYIRDAYARRGFKAAMAAAKASMDERLVDEVMLASLSAKGVAKPVPQFTRNKRGGMSPADFAEGCEPMKLAQLRAELARREAPHKTREVPKKVVVPVSTSRLTAEEIARRHAVLRNAA